MIEHPLYTGCMLSGLPPMVRKQVSIEPQQDQFLKQRAVELGVTEAELIRHGIDLLTRASATPPMDLATWADEEAFLESRAHVTPHLAGAKQRLRKRVCAA